MRVTDQEFEAHNKSEVARILHAIGQEYESARLGLEGMAIKGPHRHRIDCTEAIARSFEELHSLVGGPMKAMELLDEHLQEHL